MSSNNRYMKALEHVNESYKEEYSLFLEQRGLLEDENSAMLFLQEYEGIVDSKTLIP